MNDETLEPATQSAEPTTAFKSWMCVLCGFVYHEKEGLPEAGIAPGTRWEDVCRPTGSVPDCGAGKTDFEMTEL
jgi:rubredoxin